MIKKAENSRRYAIEFSIVGSLLIILFFVYVNFSTGSRFPWSIYPAFAVIWWPLGVIFAGRHSAKAFSLIGSLAVIILLVVTNYVTSWSYPWFLYPAFAVVWWPLAVFFGAKKGKAFSIIGSLSIIGFSIMANMITSPSYIWFIYPAFAVIWWPLSIILAKPRTIKAYSIFGALFILAFCAVDNHIHSPACPWVLFTIFPVLLWPVCVLLGKKILRLPIVLGLSAAGIAYYTVLNLLVFPGFPWAIFPAYLLAWWPLSVAFARRRRVMLFSLCGTFLSVALFIAVNIITTPQTVWAVYPIFALAWWPLSTYYFVYMPRKITGLQK